MKTKPFSLCLTILCCLPALARAQASWRLDGNSGIIPGTHFLGTTDTNALELRANNARVLRLEPGVSPNIIGGHSDNYVPPGVAGATISGGGQSSQPNQATNNFAAVNGGTANLAGAEHSTVGGGRVNINLAFSGVIAGGEFNTASASYTAVGGGGGNAATNFFSVVAGGGNNSAGGFGSTVAGGLQNFAGRDSATIGGGAANSATNDYSTVSGGRDNLAGGQYATIDGGFHNIASGDFTFIGGGSGNLATGLWAVINGGDGNLASGSFATVVSGIRNSAAGGVSTIGGGIFNTNDAQRAVIGGGELNRADSNSYYSVIGGGFQNTAGGPLACVPGGQLNSALGNCSFAAGHHATANHQGAFVWADSAEPEFASTAGDQFLIRASRGVGIGKNNPQAQLDVEGNAVFSGNVGVGTISPQAKLDVAGKVRCEVLELTSDRKVKGEFTDVDRREILSKVASLPIARWQYTNAPGICHIGPMAQDFHDAFGVGSDDKHIATVDADGVAFAAIQGLHELLQEKDTRIVALEREVASLRQETAARLAMLEKMMAQTETPPRGLARRQAAVPSTREFPHSGISSYFLSTEVSDR